MKFPNRTIPVVEAARMTRKAYQDRAPSNCFNGGRYNLIDASLKRERRSRRRGTGRYPNTLRRGESRRGH